LNLLPDSCVNYSTTIPRLYDATGLTTGWMFIYTIQPVVKPVVQQVWQPCWTNIYCSFNRVERTATVHATGCQTGL